MSKFSIRIHDTKDKQKVIDQLQFAYGNSFMLDPEQNPVTIWAEIPNTVILDNMLEYGIIKDYILCDDWKAEIRKNPKYQQWVKEGKVNF